MAQVANIAVERSRRAKAYVDRLKVLDQQRREWRETWEEVREYIHPHRGQFLDSGDEPNQGEKRTNKILNGTPTEAVQTMASGMQGGLTSPVRPWVRSTLDDLDLAKWTPVKDYLKRVDDGMHQTFGKTNWYQTTHAIYTELGSFGTAAAFANTHPSRICAFHMATTGQVYLAANMYGEVDTVFRKYMMTVRQMEQTFGRGALGQKALDQLAKNPDQYRTILHAVMPNKRYDPEANDSRGKPMQSIYVDMEDTNRFLRTGGYHEMPWLTPRWTVTGNDVYGRGPGHRTLGFSKLLQEMEKGSLVAVHMSVRPPMKAPASLRGRIKMIPAGITYVSEKESEGLKPLIDAQLQIQYVEAKIARYEQAIRRGFFNDLFEMFTPLAQPGHPDITATQVLNMKEEKMLLLEPVVHRLVMELLTPAYDRMFGLMQRAGVLPEPPQELIGREIKPEFISVMAQAQRAVAAAADRQLADYVRYLQEMDPNVIDKFNTDASIDIMSENLGATPGQVRSEQEVIEIRQVRAQQQMAEMKRQQAMEGVDALQKLGNTPMGEETALDAAVGM